MFDRIRSAVANAIAPKTTEPSASSDPYYDAINAKGRRRTASVNARRPEDKLLDQNRRDKLDANAYDLYRNLVTLRWMVRQTLNFCCTFDVQYQTADPGLNRALRERMDLACKKDQIHYVGRMNWDEIRRTQESGKITTGDAFLIPLREGTLQPMEGTYCRNPQDTQYGGRWCNGALLNKRDRVLAWNFRTEPLHGLSGVKVDRQVPAYNVWQHVQHDHRSNGVRGLAEIVSVINGLRDVGEGFDLNLLKLKVEALLGVHIKRRQGEFEELGETVTPAGEEPDDDDSTKDDLHLNFGDGPVVIDREDIEDVKLLMSSSPPQSSQEFLKLCMMVGLMALDLPYNFMDSSVANFFGNQAAWILYERSCKCRRDNQLELHQRMSNWRHWQWFLPESLGGTGEFTLPRGVDDINRLPYIWIPRGIPWWRPGEQIQADLQCVAVGWKTNQDICDERGLGNYEDNLRRMAEERAMQSRYGVTLLHNTAKHQSSLQVSGTTPTQGGAV